MHSWLRERKGDTKRDRESILTRVVDNHREVPMRASHRCVCGALRQCARHCHHPCLQPACEDERSSAAFGEEHSCHLRIRRRSAHGGLSCLCQLILFSHDRALARKREVIPVSLQTSQWSVQSTAVMHHRNVDVALECSLDRRQYLRAQTWLPACKCLCELVCASL